MYKQLQTILGELYVVVSTCVIACGVLEARGVGPVSVCALFLDGLNPLDGGWIHHASVHPAEQEGCG